MFFFSTFTSADTIKIGLRAHLGIEKSMLQWKQTADYLSKKILEHKFIMVPYVSLKELLHKVGENEFDFVITNPSSFIGMELVYGASAILTLRNKRQGKAYTQFGSVIFTGKNNQDINQIKDLTKKNIVAVSEPAFGGWRVAQREMLREGFDPYKDAKKVSFSGGIQQDVVKIVQLGNADVGVVRTDMLERMAADGLIKLDDFKIINKKSTKGFPFYHSTQLYPEWAFIKMRDTSNVLSKKVALALLTMPSEHPAAIAGKYIGWTVPEDYQPVHNLMQELKIGPYQHYYENPFEHFIDEYLVQLVVSIFILIGLVFMTLYILATNRKLLAAKNEQDKLMDELEMRVAERTQDLQIAKENAEHANNAKTEFLSSISHELRTPMNAVLGFAQLLEHDTEKQQLTEMHDSVGEILFAGRHLLELINDILDLAKIEEGKYDVELKPIRVNNIIHEVLRLLEMLAKEKKITVTYKSEVDDQFEILANYRSVKQVLINLITNAIKYNHPDGYVDINLAQQDNGFCKISVTDNGDGIAEEVINVIFDPFQRVTKRTDIEGSGVGLAITKNLVEVMDGKIQVESTLGEGSTFTLLFKLA